MTKEGKRVPLRVYSYSTASHEYAVLHGDDTLRFRLDGNVAYKEIGYCTAVHRAIIKHFKLEEYLP